MSGNTTVDRAEMAKAAQQIEEKAAQIHQTQQRRRGEGHGLERAQRRDLHALEARPRQPGLEPAAERLHLGHLRHG